MDYNGLVLKYGALPFYPDEKDDSGAYMLLDEYKIHVRRDDVSIVIGLPVKEILPLINVYPRCLKG